MPLRGAERGQRALDLALPERGLGAPELAGAELLGVDLPEAAVELEVQRLRQLARNLARPSLRGKATAALVEMLSVVVVERG